MNNKDIVTGFYTAFQDLDGEKMASFYHSEVVFKDPAFGKLKGQHAKNMWKMLCESQKGQDFQVSFDSVVVENNKATANWEAQYTFSKTGKRVHNKITANFLLKDGFIVKHTDAFDLKKWAIMALGWKGFILGGTSFFKKKLQAQTGKLLTKYEATL